MGEALPTRLGQHATPLIAPGLLTSLVLGWPLFGCSDQATSHGNPQGGPETGNSKPVALSSDPQAAIAALVATCHGVLQGQAKMTSALLHLRHNKNDDLPEQVILWTEDRMRIVRRNRQVDIRLAQGAWRLTPHASAVEHGADKIEKLDRLQSLLRAALLEPLYRAKKVALQGPSVYALTLADGTTWQLEVRSFKPTHGDAVFLPWKLKGPAGELTWHRYLHTGVTHLPDRMGLGEFGERLLSLEASDLTLDESWFSDPLNPDYVTPGRSETFVRDTNPGVKRQPGKPRIGYTRASRSIVLADPGTWTERAALVNQHARRLYAQGQEGDDLEFLFERDGVRCYAIPFTMRRDDGCPFVPDKDQEVLRLPRQRAVILRTSPLKIAEARATAGVILEQYVATNKLKVAGPLRIRPFIEMDQLIQGKLVVEEVEVQFELPIKAP